MNTETRYVVETPLPEECYARGCTQYDAVLQAVGDVLNVDRDTASREVARGRFDGSYVSRGTAEALASIANQQYRLAADGDRDWVPFCVNETRD